jgi:hypothetical protein
MLGWGRVVSGLGFDFGVDRPAKPIEKIKEGLG